MSAGTLRSIGPGAQRRKVQSLPLDFLWWAVPSYSCRHCKQRLNVRRQEYHQQGPATPIASTRERSLCWWRTLDANTRRQRSASYCHFDWKFTTSNKRRSSRRPPKFVHQVSTICFQVLNTKFERLSGSDKACHENSSDFGRCSSQYSTCVASERK
jgi:hypothetical protein